MSKILIKVIIIIFFTTNLSAADIKLKYFRYPDKREGFQPYGYCSTRGQFDCPLKKSKVKLPELKCKKPIYYLLKIGDKEMLVILDFKNTNDDFYNRIYFDANANKDLTDDPVFDGKIKIRKLSSDRKYCTVAFDPTDLKIEVKKKELPYSFIISLSCYEYNNFNISELTKKNLSRMVSFRCRLNCCYKGKFKINGKIVNIVVADYNGNGYINDVISQREMSSSYSPQKYRKVYAEGDDFYLTTDKNISYDDALKLGQYIFLNNKLYKVDIDVPNCKMSLTQVKDGLSSVSLSMEVKTMMLYNKNQSKSIMVYNSGKTINIPVDRYKIYNYKVLRKDAQGDLWQLAAGATGDTPYVKISGTGKNELKFSEPYTPIAHAGSYSKMMVEKGKPAQLSLVIEGINKEVVSGLERIQGKRTKIKLSKERGSENLPKEPSFKAITKKGEIVKEASFKYG